MAFSSDGTHLLSLGSDDQTRIWDITSPKEVASLVFIKDNKWLVSAVVRLYTSADQIRHSHMEHTMQTIDAGQMVLLLDSCHSAAVSGPNFKPGPMGDRGFGQLLCECQASRRLR